MTFKDIMVALHKVKTDAQQMGLKEKDIQNLEIIDVGLLNTIEKNHYDISLANNKGNYYLLMKKQKK